MTKDALIEILTQCAEEYDPEEAHIIADRALVEFIGDEHIRNAYGAIQKWYS